MAVATAAKTVEFVSRNASLWVSLETSHDSYDGPMGTRRTIQRARNVQFSKGRAWVDEATAAEMREHPGFGHRFWAAEDIMAPFVGDRSPKVTSGQANSISHKAIAPPLANWDTLSAREIKEMLSLGKIRDLDAAMAWEAGPGRGREQVVLAILRAKKGDGPTEDDDLPPAASVEPDGFVQSVPADARGLS